MAITYEATAALVLYVSIAAAIEVARRSWPLAQGTTPKEYK